MPSGTIPYSSIDDYISRFTPEVQDILQSIRRLIREAAPEATERIAYDMPGFALHGSLVYFAAFKKHIGFYPASSGLSDELVAEVAPYRSGRGTLQFPYGKPIPYDMLRRIVAFRAAQNKESAERKSGG
ncbi:iron chaperone [Cohnella sp. GCM10027633]|uniref:iron chaperone n=1 Tax=unclassified Cohnella TaxID=2636738 RepID=UPI0036409455